MFHFSHKSNIHEIKAAADIIEEVSATVTYFGFCKPGTLGTDEPYWSILKIDTDSPQYPVLTQFLWATGEIAYNCIWDNRADYDYYFVFTEASKFNLKNFHYYVNEVARTALRATAFTGTVRNVPGTHATITAAIAASADGDIIQLADGTYDMKDESGGYLFIDCLAKSLIIKGNATDKTAVTITMTGGSGFMMRGYRSKELWFQDLTISNAGNQNLLYVDADSANRIFCFKNVALTHTGNGSEARFIYGSNAAWSTAAALYQFDGCTFTKTLAGARPFELNNQGINTQILFNNSTINGGTYSALDWADGNEYKVALYDCIVNQASDQVAMKFGTDTTAPTKVMGLIDIRNTNIVYASGKGQHGILLGRSCKKHYIVNNRITMDNVSSALNIGIVDKATPTTLADGIIAGNIVTAPRPMLIKGGKFIKAKWNTFICNNNLYVGFDCSNTNEGDGLLQVTDLEVKNNNIFGKLAALNLAAGTDPTTTASLQTSVFNENKYYSTNGDWAVNGTTHQLATKSTLWNTATTNDDNSKMVVVNTYEISTELVDI